MRLWKMFFKTACISNDLMSCFDRYYEMSTKGETRRRRRKHLFPVRKPVDNREVHLPADFDSLMAHKENKAELASFLSQQLIFRASTNKTFVTSGGFSDEERVESFNQTVDVQSLEVKHEGADTRVILH